MDRSIVNDPSKWKKILISVLSWYMASKTIEQLKSIAIDLQEIRWTSSDAIKMGNSLIFYSGSTDKHEFISNFAVKKA